MLFCAGLEDLLPEVDAMNEDDSSKHVSSTFRGVYKRKFDTKWRAEITAGATVLLILPCCCPKQMMHKQARQVFADFCHMHLCLQHLQFYAFGPMSVTVLSHTSHMLLSFVESCLKPACVHDRTGRRKRCLGSFASEREAAEAYDKAALTLRSHISPFFQLRIVCLVEGTASTDTETCRSLHSTW